MTHLDLVTIDFETGATLEAIRNQIRARGWFALLYTMHGHLADTTEIKKDQLIRELKMSTPTIEHVCNYLRTVRKYQPEVLEDAELLPPVQRADGIMMCVQHKPVEKFRVVLALLNRFTILKRAATQTAAVTDWRERHAGLSQMLGAAFDHRLSGDPARLSLKARHPHDATEWRVEIVEGTFLDIEDCPRVAANTGDTEPVPGNDKVQWPAPFRNEDGMFGYTSKDGADAKPMFNPICGALEVKALVKDERGKGWSLLLGFHDRSGQPATVAISYSDQMADPRNVLRSLAEAGLMIINKKHEKERLFSALSQVTVKKTLVIASQPGRYGDAWLTPIGDVVNGDPDLLKLTEEPEQAAEDRSKKGDLEGWKKQVAEAFEILDFHSPVLVAATFAGVLVTMLGVDTTGLLASGGAGTGKSISQRLGAAGVGNPLSKAVCFVTGSMRGVLGLETHARIVSGSCLHMDDPFVNMHDPKMFSRFIFALQSGVSDTRGTPSGGSQRKRRWRIYWTASAEQKFKTVMESGFQQAHLTGHDVRAIPISLSDVEQHKDPVLQARVKQLDRSIGKHYGHAFPLFLKHAIKQGWMNDPDPLHERVQAAADWLVQWGAQDGIRGRAAYNLAIALVAAELCQEAKLFSTAGMGADDGYIRQAFKKAWLASMGNPDEVIGNTPQAGLQRLQQRAVVHWGAHAKDMGEMANPDQPGQSRADTWFVHGSELQVRGYSYRAVSQEAFEKLVAPSDPGAVLKLMNERKMLIRTAPAPGKNVWPNLGRTIFAHYRVLEEHLGPSDALVVHNDEDAAPIHDADETETPCQIVDRLLQTRKDFSLKFAVPPAPPKDAPDETWAAYAAYLTVLVDTAQAQKTRAFKK